MLRALLLFRHVPSVAVAALALAACQPPASATTTPYAAPAATTTSVPTLAPLTVDRPTATPPCVNGSTFLEDLTVPDGTVVSPGARLDKRWSVRNAGTCDWTAEYRLIRLDSGPLVAPGELALYPARAGAVAVWRIELIAPSEPGEYLASWQAQAPAGELFGEQVFILIEVRR